MIIYRLETTQLAGIFVITGYIFHGNFVSEGILIRNNLL